MSTGWNLENSYAQLSTVFFSRVNPSPVRSPELVVLNDSLAEVMGLNAEELRGKDNIEVFAGNRIPKNSLPIAQAYAGHQFGHFTMLGDGRALLLGEQITPLGDRFDVQLKGSGRTPYSRRGDGRAALGPMLREYIISEAMQALGIATTRSLAVVTTGEPVFRETSQTGAVLTRIAASLLRVGTFQYAANWGSLEDLRALADYAIHRHFPYIRTGKDQYLAFLNEVVKRQASLIAKWQLVGFIHGVMNTDNMAISGETIDYGPCAFMDVYDPKTVFSSIDINGRYRYENQPQMAGWNLARLAEAILPLLHDDQNKAVKLAQDAISHFFDLYSHSWLEGMRAKLGILNEEAGDITLITELLDIMQKYQADFTNTFRSLTLNSLEAMSGIPEFNQWHEKWQARLLRQAEAQNSPQELMKRYNPSIIPRNHRVEDALEAAVKEGDYQVMERLLNVLSSPYAYLPEQAEYAALPDTPDPSYRTFCGT